MISFQVFQIGSTLFSRKIEIVDNFYKQIKVFCRGDNNYSYPSIQQYTNYENYGCIESKQHNLSTHIPSSKFYNQNTFQY